MKKLYEIVFKKEYPLIFAIRIWLISIFTSLTGLFVASRLQNKSFTNMFTRWDSLFYVDIIKNGYISKLPIKDGKIFANRDAFFPGFPNVIRIFDTLLPGNHMAAGLMFNAIITLASFYILYKTLLNLCDRSKAKLTLMLFAFFPGSYIFFWFYAEALTTFLIVCAFYFLSNKRILLSSIFVGLATFTRPNAAPFISMVPIYIIWTEIDKDFYKLNLLRTKKYLFVFLKSLTTLFISASGILAFLLYLDRKTKISNSWLRIEREGWNESKQPFYRTYKNMTQIFSSQFPYNNSLIIIYALLGILLILCGTVYVHKMKYNSIVVATFIPSLFVILLALSNNTAASSPRFFVLAAPIFISIPETISNKYLKIALIPLLVLMGMTSAFYTYKINAA